MNFEKLKEASAQSTRKALSEKDAVEFIISKITE